MNEELTHFLLKSKLAYKTQPFLLSDDNRVVQVFESAIDKDGVLRIPNGVEYVGSYSIMSDNELSSRVKKLIFPDSLIKLSACAFGGYVNLESIEFGKNLESMESRVFYLCECIKSIELPDNCTKFGQGCFEGCTNLQRVKLPKFLKTLEPFTFKNCKSLIDIEFPESLEYIYLDCFEGTKLLKEVPDIYMRINHAIRRGIKFRDVNDLMKFSSDSICDF